MRKLLILGAVDIRTLTVLTEACKEKFGDEVSIVVVKEEEVDRGISIFDNPIVLQAARPMSEYYPPVGINSERVGKGGRAQKRSMFKKHRKR